MTCSNLLWESTPDLTRPSLLSCVTLGKLLKHYLNLSYPLCKMEIVKFTISWLMLQVHKPCFIFFLGIHQASLPRFDSESGITWLQVEIVHATFKPDPWNFRFSPTQTLFLWSISYMHFSGEFQRPNGWSREMNLDSLWMTVFYLDVSTQ